jgi:integral membrane sensor domain MASE1
VLAGSFAMLVRLVWSTLNFGRQFFILLVFLLANHLVMLFAYAGISGGPNYLGDGETQDCFLMQLWFKILVGLSVFTAMEMCSRRRRKSGMRGQHI